MDPDATLAELRLLLEALRDRPRPLAVPLPERLHVRQGGPGHLPSGWRAPAVRLGALTARGMGAALWEGMANVISGRGDPAVAAGMYESAVLGEVAQMRREGVYVCFANIQRRMPEYNQEMLSATLWTLARAGRLQ